MARVRRPLLLPSLVIFLLAAGFLFVTWRIGEVPSLALFTPKRQSVSWSILEEIRDLEDLETASYDMKVVFPFDFIEEDVDWRSLKYEYDRAPSRFLDKTDPAWHPGGRLPPNWEYAELYTLCREAGLDPGKPDYRFLVLSVTVTAGIDLKGWISGFQTAEPGGEVEGISVLVGEDETQTLKIRKPPVELTAFTIEDRDTGTEGLPDAPLSPEEWRVLADALEPRLRDMALSGGLIEKANSEGQAFLREIFMAAGYDDVEFSES